MLKYCKIVSGYLLALGIGFGLLENEPGFKIRLFCLAFRVRIGKLGQAGENIAILLVTKDRIVLLLVEFDFAFACFSVGCILFIQGDQNSCNTSLLMWSLYLFVYDILYRYQKHGVSNCF